MIYSSTLSHFNPNHDPRNGQFTETKYQTAGGDLKKKGKKLLMKNWTDAYNAAANKLNKAIDQINKKYDPEHNDQIVWDEKRQKYTTELGRKYVREIDQSWKKMYVTELRSRFPELVVNGDKWIKSYAPMYTMLEGMD